MTSAAIQRTLRQRALLLPPFIALLVAYLPDLGHGFIKDDFAWILGSRVDRFQQLPELFLRHNGFYRPLVSLSFALNEALAGAQPFWFGLTNLILVLAVVAGIYCLSLSLQMEAGAAALAAAVWAFNPHGVGGAILWISGRTSLLLTGFALGAAIAMVKDRKALSAVFCTLALFSKEEAVLLPAILAVWAGLDRTAGGRRWDWHRAWPWAVTLALPLALYFALRSRTGAFLPGSAPAYYRLGLAPGMVIGNVFQYLDRSCTFAAAVVTLLCASTKRLPRLSSVERVWVLYGLVWLVGGFGITVFLPVRSSLYACFPAVGTALAVGAMASSLWRQAGEPPRRWLPVAAAVLPFALLPLYWSRNVRMVRTAELSAQVLKDTGAYANDLARGALLVLHDDPMSKVNLRSAFGTLLPEALTVSTGVAAPAVWVEPPLPEWEAAGLKAPLDRPVIHLALRNGRLVPISAPAPLIEGARRPVL